jgi:hypothetical protein
LAWLEHAPELAVEVGFEVEVEIEFERALA